MFLAISLSNQLARPNRIQPVGSQSADRLTRISPQGSRAKTGQSQEKIAPAHPSTAAANS